MKNFILLIGIALCLLPFWLFGTTLTATSNNDWKPCYAKVLAQEATDISTKSYAANWNFSGANGSYNEGYTTQYSTTSDFSSGNATTSALISETSKATTGPADNTKYHKREIGKKSGSSTQGNSKVKQLTTRSLAPEYCLDFDNSDDYASINSVFGLGTTNVTIEAWVYLPTTSESGTIARLGTHDSGFGIGVGDGQFDNSGNELLVLIDIKRWIDPNVTIGTGWHHIAFSVGSSNEVNIYLDGVNVYTEASNPNPAVTPVAPSYIGAGNTTNRIFSTGKIDEVRYWSDVRTAQEIRDYMTSPLIGNESNLVAYYRLDDGSGTSVTDATINGHNGTLTNSSWVSSYAMVSTEEATDITETGFTVNWDCPAEANSSFDGYRIEYSINQDFTGSSTTDALKSETSKSITGLSHSTTYYYRVGGVRSSSAAYSNVKSLTTTGPQAPEYALDFERDNSQYANCGSINLGGSAITLECWIKPESFQTAVSPYISQIMGTESGSNSAFLRLGDVDIPAGNKIQFVLNFSGDQQKLTSTSTLETGRWYHIAGVYDGSTMKIYIDGVEDANLSQTGSFTSNSTFYLSTNDGTGRYFDGTIDEVRVWKTARLSTEINTYMTTLLNGNEPNLEAYYRCDNGSGTALSDLTSNAHNASLVNTPSWVNSYAMVIAEDATDIAETSFTANWSCPAEVNSSYDDGYTIEYSTSLDFSGSSTVTASSSETSKSITGLTAPTTYYYRLSGKRSGSGTLEYSNVKSVTISASPAYVVTSNADDGGTGTLRYIIDNCDDGATITFNLSPGNETITLGSEISVLYNNNPKSINIDGANTAGSGTEVTIQVTVPGVTNSRIFYFNPGGTYTINLSNMTLKGGNVTDNAAGTLYINNLNSCTLTNVTITGSKAPQGGGIYVFSSSLTLNNCTISNCQATSGNGGGVSNSASSGIFTVNSLSISNCTATVNGGGVYLSCLNSVNAISIDNCTASSGGGIYSQRELTLTNASITNNTASSNGGGIYLAVNQNPSITSSTISGNSADKGGGIYIQPNRDISPSLNNSTISNNSSTSDGGGICCYAGEPIMDDINLNFTVSNSTICGNTSGGNGAGLYAYGYGITGMSTSTTNVTFINSIVTYNSDGSGYDDIIGENTYNFYGDYNIIGGTQIGSNSANYSYTSGLGAELFNNYTEVSAGAIYKPVLADNGGNTETVALASNSIAIGAGVRTGEYDDNGTTKYVFHNGTNWVKAEDGSTTVGSGVTEITTDQRGFPRDPSLIAIGAYEQTLHYVVTSHLDDGGSGTLRYIIEHCEEEATITFDLGAGEETISLGSQISVSKSLIIDGDNSAGSGTDVTVQVTTPGTGGTNSRIMYANIASGKTLTLSNMTLKGGDISSGYLAPGGTLQFEGGGTCSLSNITISGSRAVRGGAVHVSGSTLNTSNCTITGNTANDNNGSGEGGAMYLLNSAVSLTNTTMTANTARINGGCIYVSGSTLSLDECTISSNSILANNSGGGIYNGSNTTTTITNSEIKNNSGYSGGGIYNYPGSTLILKNSTVSGNQCGIDSDGNVSLDNCTISDNTNIGIITSLGGMGSNDVYLRITNSVISGNTSPYDGSGLYLSNTGMGNLYVYLTNSIVAYNYKTDNSAYNDIYNYGGSLYGNYNIMGGTVLSGGNNTNYSYTSGQGDPLFESYTTISENAIYKPVLADNGGKTETVALASNSIAIGAGVRTGEYDDNGTTKYVFHNGTNWVKVEDGSTIVSSGVTEITTDQRDLTRHQYYPSIGSYEPTNYNQQWTGNVSNSWITAGNWSPQALPTASDDITIPQMEGKSPSPAIAETDTANCNDITVQAGAYLTILSSSSGTGSLIIKGDTSNSGTITSQSYLPGSAQAWHMFSSPAVCDISDNGWNPGANDDFFAWLETSPGTWINYKTDDPQQDPTFAEVNGSDNFVAGKGYLTAYNSENPTKSIIGTPNTGTINFPLANTSSKSWTYNSGWNLMGNPYSSSIDWNLANLSKFQDNYAYIYNPNKEGGAGFISVDGGAADAFIPPHQGFFAVAKEAAIGENFTFTPAMQTHGNSSHIYKEKEAENSIVLILKAAQYYDETKIRIDSRSTWKRDRFDALKLFSYNTEVPQLYSLADDDISLAINGIPEAQSRDYMPLGLLLPEADHYEIALLSAEGSFAPAEILLEDKNTGTRHKLKSSSYHFNGEKGLSEDRFVLIFKGITGIDDIAEDANINIWQQGNQIILRGDTEIKRITLTDITGRTLGVWESTENIPAPNTAGVYLVTVETDHNRITKKIIVK